MMHRIPLVRRRWLGGLAAVVALGAAAPLHAQARALGIDTAGFDRGVRPQDDFFAYVNGGWLRAVQIPADRPGWGLRDVLIERSEATIHQILDEAVATGGPAPGSDTQKLGDLYASFMDSARIEAAGATPVQADLARIRAASGRGDYPALFARAAGMGVASPFAVVLLDVTLPDRAGTELVPELRTLVPASRVVLTSGKGEEDFPDHGADGYLPKPFTKEQLLAAVRAVMRAV